MKNLAALDYSLLAKLIRCYEKHDFSGRSWKPPRCLCLTPLSVLLSDIVSVCKTFSVRVSARNAALPLQTLSDYACVCLSRLFVRKFEICFCQRTTKCSEISQIVARV
jgi:hypothetical protein